MTVISTQAARRAQDSIRQVAQRNGVSEEAVRQAIMEAIEAGMANQDPAVKARWKNSPWQSGNPTPEEFVAWNAKQVLEKELNG